MTIPGGKQVAPNTNRVKGSFRSDSTCGGPIMHAEHPSEFTVALNEKEQGVLLHLLEQSLVDTRGEKRRTEGPGCRAQIQPRESIIGGMTEKVRQLHS